VSGSGGGVGAEVGPVMPCRRDRCGRFLTTQRVLPFWLYSWCEPMRGFGFRWPRRMPSPMSRRADAHWAGVASSTAPSAAFHDRPVVECDGGEEGERRLLTRG